MRSKKKQIAGLALVFLLLLNLSTVNVVLSEQPSSTFNSKFVQQDTIDFIEYRAVIVGINYLGGSTLPYSYQQLKGFKTTLLNGGNWKESNIKTIINVKATKTNIVNNIEWLADNADDNDVSIFYFIGHGGQDSTNEYIIPHEELIYDFELDNYLDNISGKVIVLLDTCYSGGFIEELKKPERIILTACAKDEKTYQVEELQSGIFGYFLNMSLAWFSKNAEHTYFFTKIFTWYYGKKISEEYEGDYAIHPQIYDGSFGTTRIIRKHSYVKKIVNMILTMSDFDDHTKFWRMENKTLTPTQSV